MQGLARWEVEFRRLRGSIACKLVIWVAIEIDMGAMGSG
jgi:hypothetical protein